MEFVESLIEGVFNVFVDDEYVGHLVKVKKEYLFNGSSNAYGLSAQELKQIAEFMEKGLQ